MRHARETDGLEVEGFMTPEVAMSIQYDLSRYLFT